MRISDWSSDVCSSDLYSIRKATVERNDRLVCWRCVVIVHTFGTRDQLCAFIAILHRLLAVSDKSFDLNVLRLHSGVWDGFLWGGRLLLWRTAFRACRACLRLEEHTSELQSLMRISYAVFCLNNKN